MVGRLLAHARQGRPRRGTTAAAVLLNLVQEERRARPRTPRARRAADLRSCIGLVAAVSRAKVGWSDTPRIKYIMFLPNTPLLLLATVVRGVNTLLGRADAVMATARGALPRKSITSSVPVLIPCCFAMSRKPDFQPAAQRQLGGLRTILRSLPQTCAGSDIP